MTLVLDCVPFFQESDIWRLRYETLRDVVDGFVVVEAAHTHSGQAKGITFQEPNRRDGGPPVLPWHIDLPEPSTPGLPATRRREMFQRNSIFHAVQHLLYHGHADIRDDTILLISDCDEIPRTEAITALRERGLNDGEVATFLQRLSYYNLNTISPQPWPGTRAARWADVRALSPHVIRCGLGQPDEHYPIPLLFTAEGWQSARGQHAPLVWAGWHLSYFGGAEQVAAKMRAFLHQELVNGENTDPATIAARIQQGQDVWGRPDNAHGLKLGPASDLPPPIAADPARWAHFFHPDYRPEVPA